MVNPRLAYKLCTAAYKGDLQALKSLALKGADLEVSDYDGRTAIHLAASENKTEVVKWLLA